MVITDVAKRRKSLFQIMVDDEPILIDKETFLLSRFKLGSTITYEELEELKMNSENHRAKQKALWLLSRRDYSKTELVNKLARETSKEAAVKAAERMEEVGVIDDIRFAKKYAADLFHFKRMSARMVLYELMQKGIDKETATDIIEELAIDEDESLADTIERKFLNNLSTEKELRRVYAFFTRKGYSYDQIKTAINKYSKDED